MYNAKGAIIRKDMDPPHIVKYVVLFVRRFPKAPFADYVKYQAENPLYKKGSGDAKKNKRKNDKAKTKKEQAKKINFCVFFEVLSDFCFVNCFLLLLLNFTFICFTLLKQIKTPSSFSLLQNLPINIEFKPITSRFPLGI